MSPDLRSHGYSIPSQKLSEFSAHFSTASSWERPNMTDFPANSGNRIVLSILVIVSCMVLTTSCAWKRYPDMLAVSIRVLNYQYSSSVYLFNYMSFWLIDWEFLSKSSIYSHTTFLRLIGVKSMSKNKYKKILLQIKTRLQTEHVMYPASQRNRHLRSKIFFYVFLVSSKNRFLDLSRTLNV